MLKYLTIRLLEETFDNPFNLFASVASGPDFQSLHALIE
jgi:hypothetical protein